MWGKMRTAARETAPQIALRGSWGRSIYKVLVKEEFSAVKSLQKFFC